METKKHLLAKMPSLPDFMITFASLFSKGATGKSMTPILTMLQAATSTEGDQTAGSATSSASQLPGKAEKVKQQSPATGTANGGSKQDEASQQSIEAARRAEKARREAKAEAGPGKGQPQAAPGPPHVSVCCCEC